MTNKEAIDIFKRTVYLIKKGELGAPLSELDVPLLELAITAIEKMDKVRFVTEGDIINFCNKKGDPISYKIMSHIFDVCKYVGIIIDPPKEKRCKWTDGVITTNISFTEKELKEQYFCNGSSDWHPVEGTEEES